jgi:hypothetical protein
MDKNEHNDELDRILEQFGFYEVQTANKRIWTLLLSDVSQSLSLYDYLKSYFNQMGGILELELEFIKELQVLPSDYLLPKCLKTIQCELIYTPECSGMRGQSQLCLPIHSLKNEQAV